MRKYQVDERNSPNGALILWAVFAPSGWPLPGSVSTTRKDAIARANYITSARFGSKWSARYKAGYYARRVKIVPVEGE